MAKIKMDEKTKQELEAANQRLDKAVVYLMAKGIDINSRADDHYRNAIFIAAGFKLEVKLPPGEAFTYIVSDLAP